jgi:isopenicillin N synthase-like dioxygenase
METKTRHGPVVTVPISPKASKPPGTETISHRLRVSTVSILVGDVWERQVCRERAANRSGGRPFAYRAPMESQMQLDLIDLTAPIDKQARSMARACKEVGFFCIPLESIERSIADAAWNDAAKFFALAEDEKRRIEFPEPGYPYGFSPFGFESLAKSTGAESPPPDLKESLSVGPDCGANPTPASTDDAWIRSTSLWPEHPPRLRESWTAYYRALAAVSEHLMSVMAIALDLPADFFDPLIDRPITSMRALNYPAIETGAVELDALRAGAHSDYGTLTILRTDDVAGLQIESADGSWIDIAPDPNSFVVNLGDSIAQWTNDRWRSTVHRVTAADPSARQSMAFFHMANWDATIECLPTCVEQGRAPKHEPVQAGPWLMRKFQSTVN